MPKPVSSRRRLSSRRWRDRAERDAGAWYASDLEPANLGRLAAWARCGQAGITVIHVTVLDTHPVRVGIAGSGDGDDLEHLARFGIDPLHQMIAGNQDPQRAIVPVEPVRPVAFRGAHAQDAKVLRI